MPKNILFSLSHSSAENTFYQLSHDRLIQQCIEEKEGTPNNVGKQAGDISQDIFVVKHHTTADESDWDDNHKPIEEGVFNSLYQKMTEHLGKKNIWIRDAYIDTDATGRLYIRSICEDPASDLFVYNMLGHPAQKEIENFKPDWHLIHTPTFSSGSESGSIGITNGMFINFTKRVILVRGLAYDNEIKEKIFSTLGLKAVS